MQNIPIYPNKITREFKSGVESVVYYYEDEKYYDKPVLLKKYRSSRYLKDYRGIILDSNVLENKYNKIIIITSSACLKDEIKILDAGFIDGEFKCYTMKKSSLNPVNIKYFTYKDENGKPSYYIKYVDRNGKPISLTDKIKYLKLLRKKIELLNNNDVYIGDYNCDNFLVSSDFSQMQLCDLDNLKIGSHDFDLKHKFVEFYESKCCDDQKKIEEYDGLDSYCFNLFTIAFLTDKRNNEIFSNIDSIELPEVLKDFPNEEILDSIKHLDKTYKPRYLIDSIK